jgi:hypothetical protein
MDRPLVRDIQAQRVTIRSTIEVRPLRARLVRPPVISFRQQWHDLRLLIPVKVWQLTIPSPTLTPFLAFLRIVDSRR